MTTLANIAAHTAHVAHTIPGRRARNVATLADLLANRLPDTSHPASPPPSGASPPTASARRLRDLNRSTA